MNIPQKHLQPSYPWPSPAKLNLFLHITGQRNDGYHLLQTIFQFIDYGDSLYFHVRSDNKIAVSPSLPNVKSDDNIIVKAAKALQKHTNCPLGADITLTKTIPMGGGLGGGSSNAATTLLALNALWKTQVCKSELMKIGLNLGADVPIFIHGHNAWAEGVGEEFIDVKTPENWFLVIFPKINVNTAEIFSSSQLTRDKLPIKIRDFLNGATENVFEPVVTAQYPEIKEALNWLNQHSKARLTGTGACIFASFESENGAAKVAAEVPNKWQAFIAKGLNKTHIETFYWGVAKW